MKRKIIVSIPTQMRIVGWLAVLLAILIGTCLVSRAENIIRNPVTPLVVYPERPMYAADRLAYYRALHGSDSKPLDSQLSALDPAAIYRWQHFKIVSNGTVYVATGIAHVPVHNALWDWWWWLRGIAESGGAKAPFTKEQSTQAMAAWYTKATSAVKAAAESKDAALAISAQVPVNDITLACVTAESVWRDLQLYGYGDLNIEPPKTLYVTNLVYSPLAQ